MTKRLIGLILIFSMLYCVIPSFASLQQERSTSSTTKLRMEPLVKKYNALTEAELTAQASKYPDITTHYAKDNVAKMSTLEVINGYPNGKFGPNDTLLASQFIKMVICALGFKPEVPSWQPFWVPYVDIALQEGIILEGEIADYNKPLSRELAAVIATRALFLYETQPTGDDVYYDYNVSKMSDFALITDQYKQSVVLSYRMGLIIGSNNLFDPKGTLTRANGAIIVNRLIDNNIRTESVLKPEEIITFTRRTDINEANFDFNLKPGETFKVYPGYFPLNEIFPVFKAMNDFVNLGGGYREVCFSGLEGNFCTWMYNSKEEADRFFLIDNRYPTHYADFGVYLNKTKNPGELNDNDIGYLYSACTEDPTNYNKYMKTYTYELLKVLFENEADEAIELHDYYLDIALNNKPTEYKSYMINNRKVHYSGGGSNQYSYSGGFTMYIWAKGAITLDNFGN